MIDPIPCPNPVCTEVFSPEAVAGRAQLTCPRCGQVFHFQVPVPPASAPRPASPPAGPRSAAAPAPVPPRPTAPPAPLPSSPQGKVPIAPLAQPRPVAPPPPPPRAVPVKPPVAIPIKPVPPLPPPPPVYLELPDVPPPEPVPPLAVPVAVPEPLPMPEPDPAPVPELAFDHPGETITPISRRYQGRSSNALRLVLVLVLTGAIVAGVGYGFVQFLAHLRLGENTSDRAIVHPELNFRFVPPDWKPDEKLREALGAFRAWSDPAKGRGLAIIAEDYENKLPADADLLDNILGRLEKNAEGKGLFDRGSFVWYPLEPATVEKFEPNGELGGQKARIFGFDGNINNAPREGQCHFLTHQGYAHWFVVFGPRQESKETSQRLAREFDTLRATFKLLNQRPGWQPTLTDARAFNGGTWLIRYSTDIWEERKKDENEPDDPREVLYLLGRDPQLVRTLPSSEALHVRNRGHFSVLSLPGADDLKAAHEMAKKHVRQSYARLNAIKEEDVHLEIERDRLGKDRAGERPIGKSPGFLAHYRLLISGASPRYLLLAVVRQGNTTITFRGDCLHDRRHLWQQEFQLLLRTFEETEK